MDRLPVFGVADRVARWDWDGLARRRAASPVIVRHVSSSTNPSDLSVSINDAPVLTKQLERLAGVERVEAAVTSLNAFPLTPRGTPILPTAFTSGEVQPIGSIDGEYF